MEIPELLVAIIAFFIIGVFTGILLNELGGAPDVARATIEDLRYYNEPLYEECYGK